MIKKITNKIKIKLIGILEAQITKMLKFNQKTKKANRMIKLNMKNQILSLKRKRILKWMILV